MFLIEYDIANITVYIKMTLSPPPIFHEKWKLEEKGKNMMKKWLYTPFFLQTFSPLNTLYN